MFGRAIWDKLPQEIFKNFEKFQKSRGWLSPKSPEPNQQALCIDNYKNHQKMVKN